MQNNNNDCKIKYALTDYKRQLELHQIKYNNNHKFPIYSI